MWNTLGSIPPLRVEPMVGTSRTRVLPGPPTNLKWLLNFDPLRMTPSVHRVEHRNVLDPVLAPVPDPAVAGRGSSPFHRFRHEAGAALQLLASVSHSCSGSKIPYKETGGPVCGSRAQLVQPWSDPQLVPLWCSICQCWAGRWDGVGVGVGVT